MRTLKGSICKMGTEWAVRYPEQRNINGELVKKKASHKLGPITTRGKRPPADIIEAAREHMKTVNGSELPSSSNVTLSAFVENVFLPDVRQHLRASTAISYESLWRLHIRAHAATDENKREVWLKNVRTFHVQAWLNEIAKDAANTGVKESRPLARSSLQRIQSVLSAIFTTAARLQYLSGPNPVHGTRVDPRAPGKRETHAYDLEEIAAWLGLLGEPAGTIFAVAAFTGMRAGEIQGARWEDLRNGALYVERAIWEGKVGATKTKSSVAPVPLLRQLAERLAIHRLRDGSPESGPIFRNSLGKPLSLRNVLERQILPLIDHCAICGEGKHHTNHPKGTPRYDSEHGFQVNPKLPKWHGWHACRRGLASNLNRLGVDDSVIQRILRHSSISTTQDAYIKTASSDAIEAMRKLDLALSGHQRDTKPEPGRLPETVN